MKSHRMGTKYIRPMMAGLFDLAEILELIHAFDERALAGVDVDLPERPLADSAVPYLAPYLSRPESAPALRLAQD